VTFVEAAAALRALGGIARTADLRQHGVTARELQRALHDTEVVRPRQGIYALPSVVQAVIHAASHGGVPGCTTAAALHGLWVLESLGMHVWMGAHSRSRRHCTQCRLHWDDGDVQLGVLPPVRNVLLHIALCLGEESFFAALESALRQERLGRSDLVWLRKRPPGRLRWLIGFARSDADSGLESLVRLRLHHLGVDARTQVWVAGVGKVDLMIGARLIIELDGRANHAGTDKRHKDLRRDAEAAARGYVTLRFDYALVIHDWPLAERAILARIASSARV